VALGLCKQSELDAAVQKANAKKLAEGAAMTDDERRKLVSTQTSLGMDTDPAVPASMAGLETFSLSTPDEDKPEPTPDADTFFNLPDSSEDDEDDED
jgi:hypothetical protein